MEKQLTELRRWGANIDEAMTRFDNDLELYGDCLRMVLNDEGFGELDAAIRAQRYAEAFDQAHKLKGVVANMGLTPLLQTIHVLVEHLRAKRYPPVDSALKDVQNTLRELRELLAAQGFLLQ